MAPLDFEMAQMLHGEIRDKGIRLELGDPVASFEDKGDTVVTTLKSGTAVEAELVVLSIGVRPNSGIAKDADLPLNARGGILVDDYMQTEDPNIFAVGDVVEVLDFNTGGRTMVPLAGPANKQGRIVADNLAAVAKGESRVVRSSKCLTTPLPRPVGTRRRSSPQDSKKAGTTRSSTSPRTTTRATTPARCRWSSS